MLPQADGCVETTTTTGTGDITVAGPVAGRQSLSARIANGAKFPYYIEGVDASYNPTGEFESGIGTMLTSTTFSRSPIQSSNADALVSFSAGTKLVSVAVPAKHTLALESDLAFSLPAVGSSAIAAAVTDYLKIFSRKVAGRMTLKYVGPSGVDQVVQDKISENGQVIYLPNNGTTVGLNLGQAWTTSGTVSHPTPSSTAPAIYSQRKRTRWANVVTTTNQTLGLRTATAEKRFWRGNAAGLGGFNFHCRFAIGLWPAATVRLFVGLSDQNAAVVASDTLAGNCCGLWHDTTEAASVLNFVTRNGTSSTKAAITLAANLAAGRCFDFWMWSDPNGGVIGYKLVELNTGTTLVDTTTSTNIPLATAFMGPEMMMSNGTANITVTTTAMEVMAFSCQSDN